MDWTTYFLEIAKVVAEKSKDPSSKVGAVITTDDYRPVSFGFNGFIQGANEKYMTQERPLKYNLVIHAEMNAILLAKGKDLNGCVLYCTHPPCENCLKHIAQTGIRKVFYLSKNTNIVERYNKLQMEAIIRILKATNLKVYTENSSPYLSTMESYASLL